MKKHKNQGEALLEAVQQNCFAEALVIARDDKFYPDGPVSTKALLAVLNRDSKTHPWHEVLAEALGTKLVKPETLGKIFLRAVQKNSVEAAAIVAQQREINPSEENTSKALQLILGKEDDSWQGVVSLISSKVSDNLAHERWPGLPPHFLP